MVHHQIVVCCTRMLMHGLRDPLPPILGYDEMLDHVSVGHVGYMDKGRFVLLFDAAQPIGSRREGRDVPQGFTYNEGIGAGRSHPRESSPRPAYTKSHGFKMCRGVELGAGISG
jgi:hypothetical protein